MLATHQTCQSPQEARSKIAVGTAHRTADQASEPPPIDDGLLAMDAALREGDTRMCMMGPAGALFETDYHREPGGDHVFTVLWLNADASGYMDEAQGDRILAIRH